jgi:hypothetical protein
MSSSSKIAPSSTEVHPLQDFDGEPQDANAGREYFKKRFARLAHKAGRSKEREIYIQSVVFLVVVVLHTDTWSALQLQQIPRYCE